MRKSKNRKLDNTIVIIVDGEDEKWYIEKVKEHYPKKCLRKMSVKPELAKEKKKVDELFSLAKEKVELGYSQTILILDMDNILKEKTELRKFKEYYQYYSKACNDTLVGKSKNKWGWMKNMYIVVNTPCLEFWFLLHFNKTNKFFPNYEALKKDLKKNTCLKDYEKSEDYYKNHPDIYIRLGEESGIQTACNNAIRFSMDNEQQGVSEMNLVFDLFDRLG